MAFVVRRCSRSLVPSPRAASFLNTATVSTLLPPSCRPPLAAPYCSSSIEILLRKLTPSPMLMYPTPIKDAYDDNQRSYRLYSLVDQKVVHLPATTPDDILQTSPLGPSSIDSVASISSLDCSMFVYQPFILALFFLPPFETLPFVTRKHRSTWLGKIGYILDGNQSCSYANDVISESFVNKLIVSRMCFAICGPKREVAYCRYGDSTWRDFGRLIPGNYQYHDIVHFKKEIYYALVRSSTDGTSNYSVVRWDFRTWASSVVLTNVHPQLPNKSYLINSGGDMLMIVRYFCNPKKNDESEDSSQDNINVRKSFDVYKLDIEKSSWELVNSIGDHALFLGPNYNAFSLPTSSYPGLTNNSIYFTSDKAEEYGSNYKNDQQKVLRFTSDDNKHDFGVFSIGDNSIKFCSTPFSFPKSDHQSPYWVVLLQEIKEAIIGKHST